MPPKTHWSGQALPADRFETAAAWAPALASCEVPAASLRVQLQVTQHGSGLSTNAALELYAWYKQATCGQGLRDHDKEIQRAHLVSAGSWHQVARRPLH